jgi:hypothetical protein
LVGSQLHLSWPRRHVRDSVSSTSQSWSTSSSSPRSRHLVASPMVTDDRTPGPAVGGTTCSTENLQRLRPRRRVRAWRAVAPHPSPTPQTLTHTLTHSHTLTYLHTLTHKLTSGPSPHGTTRQIRMKRTLRGGVPADSYSRSFCAEERALTVSAAFLNHASASTMRATTSTSAGTTFSRSTRSANTEETVKAWAPQWG